MPIMGLSKADDHYIIDDSSREHAASAAALVLLVSTRVESDKVSPAVWHSAPRGCRADKAGAREIWVHPVDLWGPAMAWSALKQEGRYPLTGGCRRSTVFSKMDLGTYCLTAWQALMHQSYTVSAGVQETKVEGKTSRIDIEPGSQEHLVRLEQL
jgi:hypothetical protein